MLLNIFNLFLLYFFSVKCILALSSKFVIKKFGHLPPIIPIARGNRNCLHEIAPRKYNWEFSYKRKYE